MGEIMYHGFESDCTLAIKSGASQMQQFVNHGFVMIYRDSNMHHFYKWGLCKNHREIVRICDIIVLEKVRTILAKK